jgi:HAE1 family hydrophobic/amphiphilic exporter-1
MNLIDLSIKRPSFITSIMIISIITGMICFKNMSIDLYPDVNIPVIDVLIGYKGAGPSEIETLISKPLEEQISTISGLKTITSKSARGMSEITAEFNQNVDIKYAEQQIRDKVNSSRYLMPKDIEEPSINRVDLSAEPIMTIAFSGDIEESKLYDLANKFIKPRIEQVQNVGMVRISGGRSRQINVTLDTGLLKNRQISLLSVSKQLESSGNNTPIGKVSYGDQEIIFQNYGEFKNIDEISNVIVNFHGNESPTRISDLGKVSDGLADEQSRAYINGQKSLFLVIYRQPSSNIVAIVDDLKLQLEQITPELTKINEKLKVDIIQDNSDHIRKNIIDVYLTIAISIILTILTVFFFLANFRATIITAISLPICLIGAFIIIYIAGFSINVITLLALSLAVGLLIDDAIVVTENIYQKIEAGKSPILAASIGAKEILMAVVAITLVVVSVFIPVAFMKGIVGQFLKEFGLTICFAVLISFFVAVTIIPVLCAYFAKEEKTNKKTNHKFSAIEDKIQRMLDKFNIFQHHLADKYEKILLYSIKNPKFILLTTLLIFAISAICFIYIPKSFMDPSDTGEINISIELEPDANLARTSDVANKISQVASSNQEVKMVQTVAAGGDLAQSNKARIYIELKDQKDRKISTSEFETKLRSQIKDFDYAKPIIGSYGQPFNLILSSNDQDELEKYSALLTKELESNKYFKDISSNLKEARSEFRTEIKSNLAEIYGVNSELIGNELKGYVNGFTAAKFRQNGIEYDIVVRVKEEQRDIRKNFNNIYVPNINQKLVKLSDVAIGYEAKEPAVINRQNRSRYIKITGNIANGSGLSDGINAVEKIFKSKELKLPATIKYRFGGSTEDMQDMFSSLPMIISIAVIFIYLILASLYESFIIPLTILLSIPLALCGVFLALFIFHKSFNLYATLGLFMLLGISSKNSILLVDVATKAIAAGKSRSEALVLAGRSRLRPILMTSFALISGTIPVAIGLGESAAHRTSMGVAIIGGMISSTILTLVVVPAVFSYIDRFKVWTKARLAHLINHE